VYSSSSLRVSLSSHVPKFGQGIHRPCVSVAPHHGHGVIACESPPQTWFVPHTRSASSSQRDTPLGWMRIGYTSGEKFVFASVGAPDSSSMQTAHLHLRVGHGGGDKRAWGGAVVWRCASHLARTAAGGSTPSLAPACDSVRTTIPRLRSSHVTWVCSRVPPISVVIWPAHLLVFNVRTAGNVSMTSVRTSSSTDAASCMNRCSISLMVSTDATGLSGSTTTSSTQILPDRELKAQPRLTFQRQRLQRHGHPTAAAQ
jgi:hypothetical protein